MLRTCTALLRTSIIVLLCLLNFGFGYCEGNVLPTGGGAVGICYVCLMTTQVHDLARRENRGGPAISCVAPPIGEPSVDGSAFDDDPIMQMVDQSRYAFLLRRQVVGSLSEEQFRQALDAFQRGMAFVPEGDVEVSAGTEFSANDFGGDAADCPPAGNILRVEPFFMDRWPVTNRQFYAFVAAGGYGETVFWEARIWTAVLDMVDQTGLPGPRFWRNGRCLPGEEELPVVGISWHEAAAYARWLCKRLPTNAEWVKAASWPVSIDAKTLVHRRYPWGNAMDRSRANIWGSGPNRIVAVGEFAEGASVSGIYQLIGNVWEWIDGDFIARPGDGKLELPTPMKSIRGGAFDTYFDSQANTQFQSGENLLSRRHNVGFRCAIGMHDVVLARASSETPATGTDRSGEKYEETAT